MRKLITFFAVLLAFTAVNAQVTINGDNAFSLGQTITYQKVFAPDEFRTGASGANVVWNYDTLVLAQAPNTNVFEYLDPTGLPHADVMPEVKIAEKLNGLDNGYFYFDNGVVSNGNKWRRSGFYAYDASQDLELWINYKNGVPLKLYPYDFTYESTYDTIFGADGGYRLGSIAEDVVQVPELGEYHFDCDAYGMLILPHKVYPNALRVHVTENFEIQLLMGGSPAMTMQVSDEAYYWFVEGIDGPVFSYVVSSGGSKETTYTLQWQAPTETAISVDFVADQLSGNTDDVFSFTNLSFPLNEGSVFEWTFEPSTVQYMDSTNANSVHPKVRFTEPGTYSATLNITNTNYALQLQARQKQIISRLSLHRNW